MLAIIREVLQQVPIPVLAVDDTDMIAFVNAAATDLLQGRGMSMGGDAQKLLPDILHAANGGTASMKIGNARYFPAMRAMGIASRSRGYQVVTATSGRDGLDGLEILRQQAVDLVISDMRMPEMNGAQFLEAVRQESPQTIRLLLTGYADIASILDAINRGEIHRYITKPWDDNDLLLIVRHAIERQRLEQDKQRLEALTSRQNDELKALNASLEEKVRLRTAELHKAHDGLLKFNARLKMSFLVSIKVFSNLIKRYDPLVTDAFVAMLDGAATGRINGPANAPLRPVATVLAPALRPGAKLARDLVTADGSMLLSAEHVLDARLIKQIIDFEGAQAVPLLVTIHQEWTTGAC